MRTTTTCTLAIGLTLSLLAGMAGADPKHDKHQQKAEHERQKREQKRDHEERKQDQREEHEYRKSEQRAEHEYRKAEKKSARFRDDQRSRVISYYRERYDGGRSCPPGMRRDGDRCRLPGQRRYVVGHALTHEISFHPLPQDLLVMLAAPPTGFAYAFVDGDVILYEVPTRVVVDVVVAPF